MGSSPINGHLNFTKGKILVASNAVNELLFHPVSYSNEPAHWSGATIRREDLNFFSGISESWLEFWLSK